MNEHPKVYLSVSPIAFANLIEYLRRHETDIGSCMNDFGDLRELYIDVIGDGPDICKRDES